MARRIPTHQNYSVDKRPMSSDKMPEYYKSNDKPMSKEDMMRDDSDDANTFERVSIFHTDLKIQTIFSLIFCIIFSTLFATY
jgi:hypothetical protein